MVPDAIAATIGNAIAGKIQQGQASQRQRQTERAVAAAREQLAAAARERGAPADAFENFDPEALRTQGFQAGRYTIQVRDDGTGFQDTAPKVLRNGKMAPDDRADVGGTILRGQPGAEYTLEWVARTEGGAGVHAISRGEGQRYLITGGAQTISDLGVSIDYGSDPYQMSTAFAVAAAEARAQVRAEQVAENRAQFWTGYSASAAASRDFSNQAVAATGRALLENGTPYGTYLDIKEGNYLDAALALTPMTRQLNRVLPTSALRQTGAGSILGAADDAYEAIRRNTLDVSKIAENTGYKATNIQKVKDHLFMDSHVLDRYESLGIPSKVSRFDSDIGIAEAWGRLEAGTYSSADLQLLRHETAESWYMRNVSPGYSAAHNAAERRFPAPRF